MQIWCFKKKASDDVADKTVADHAINSTEFFELDGTRNGDACSSDHQSMTQVFGI